MANEKFEMRYNEIWKIFFLTFELMAWHLDLEALMVY